MNQYSQNPHHTAQARTPFRSASPSVDVRFASMCSSPANRVFMRLILLICGVALAVAVWPVTIGLLLVWCLAQLSYGAGKASRYRF